jgi:putative hydrolase of the HAD superfamily
MKRGFNHVDSWIFDLDNTLYPASCRLFDQIDERIGAFVARLLKVELAEAKRIQKGYFYEYGTTLRGLMTLHGVPPDAFLDYVHDIDHTPVACNPSLDRALHALPGRKLVFTNGTLRHAERVLARLGVTHHFGDIFDIVHSDYIPKPAIGPYRKFIADTAIEPKNAAMFEDIARNLEAPHSLGMTTVLVTSPENQDAARLNAMGGGGHVDHVTHDLAAFLIDITTALAQNR